MSEKWGIGLGNNSDAIFSLSPRQNKDAANMNLIAICYGKNIGTHAHLIAAAPETKKQRDGLLAVCKKLFQFIEEGLLVRNTKDDSSPEWVLKGMELVLALQEGRAAIEQAEKD